jgi:hypothetical protein
VTAQQDIATNWIAAYRKYFKTNRPIARKSSVLGDDDGIGVVEASNSVSHAASLRGWFTCCVRPVGLDVLVEMISCSARSPAQSHDDDQRPCERAQPSFPRV